MQAIGKHISLHLLLNLGCTTDLGYRPGGILSQWTCTKSCVISGQLYHSLSSPYMQLNTPLHTSHPLVISAWSEIGADLSTEATMPDSCRT